MQTLVRALLIALSLFAAGHAGAQTYPDRAIRIIVGFTPGSATDISGRMFAQKLTEVFGVPVTVENIPGAGGSVGAERVARSTPDGYTLYWGANGAMTINPSLQPNPAFDPARDLAPVARLLVSPSILAVNNDVPAKSVAELIALAKAQPGKLSLRQPRCRARRSTSRARCSRASSASTSCTCRISGANFTDVIGGRITMTLQNAGAILPTRARGQAARARHHGAASARPTCRNCRP